MATSLETNLKTPKYVQLADQLRQLISDGEFPPHAPLPSFIEMRVRFDATQRTVEKAHLILEEDGLIRRESRRGLFVNDLSLRVKTDLVAFVDDKVARELPYHREIQQGIRLQAEVCGKSVTLVDNPVSFKHWKTMDGIVIDKFGPFHEDHFKHQCPKTIPVVRLHYLEKGFSTVMADDAAGIKMAVKHLCELDHRRIGFVMRNMELEDRSGTPSINRVRHDAYCEALKINGITVHPEWTNSYQCKHLDFREDGYDVMRRWLQEGWRDLKLTAMLAQNDQLASGMIRALQEEGFCVPEDVSVVGFDGCGTSDNASLNLTTVVVPLREIGATAMRVLAQHIIQPNRPCEIIKLPVHLHIGESTARLKR